MGIGYCRRLIGVGLICCALLASQAWADCSDGTGGFSVKVASGLGTLAGEQRIEALIRRGEASRGRGHYPDAEADFREALEEARTVNQPSLAVVAEQGLGYICFLRNDPARAETLLRSSLDKAKGLGQPALIAGCANHLASVVASLGRRPEAEGLYREGLAQAAAINDPALLAVLHRNLAGVLIDDQQAMMELLAARKAADRIAAAPEHIGILLAIALEAKKKGDRQVVASFTHDVLREAYHLSSASAATREHSLAAGELGVLYEKHGRVEEAKGLTAEALAAAQAVRADDLLLRWDWQLGRLLNLQGDRRNAIAAYRRAVNHIEAIRQDIPITYQDGRSSFREMLAPIYFGLADMLLQQSALEPEEETRQVLLREARDTVERIKRSEMQDYFRDRCIASRSRDIETLSATTAVLYPIVLSERLELLLDISGYIHRKTVLVTQKDLDAVATQLAHNMRGNQFYEEPSKQIYSWLIKPVIPVLEENRVDTLVFAPDGVLRLLPIAALWDGEHFLVERYALVTSPGLTLLDPAPLPRGEMSALLAGMSDPGPVVEELPTNLLRGLRQAASRQLARGGVRGLSVEVEALEPPGASGGGEAGQEVGMEGVRQMLSLPGVDKEIDALAQQLQGQVLLNQDFQLKRFSSEIESKPFRVVHIASHGYFGGAPEQNFIMTYDRRLSMNELEMLIKPKQFAKQPVEMITLSACQTAEGDDRSPLGLSGVALKSGARSAVGTLWPVSDDAAQELLPAFYKNLQNPKTSKAEALRQAQVELLQKEKFRHPFYWSPFILVGNWL